jgi:hypothetical protein
MFTFVMEFRGGTYVYQVHKPTIVAAMAEYANDLRQRVAVPSFDQRIAELIAKAIESDEPAPLHGLSAAWCSWITVGRSSALITIVETVQRQPKTIKDT